MALDPRVILGLQSPQGLFPISGMRPPTELENQQLQQNAELFPLKRQEAQLGLNTSELELEAVQLKQKELREADYALTNIFPAIEFGDMKGAESAIVSSNILDDDDKRTFINALKNPAQLQQLKSRAESKLMPGGLTAAQKEFEFLSRAGNFTPEEKRNAALFAAGQRARPTEAITLAGDEGLTGRVAESKAEIESAKEAAKTAANLNTRYKLEPAVKEAVTLAVGRANSVGAQNELKRSNAAALSVYETAMGSLIEGLKLPITGAIVGRLPALTANQQIADGASAIMAPVLKQIFRVAGEGTFTDRDQELLMEMVPTRKDEPEARRTKIDFINSVINAKLGAGASITTDVDQNNTSIEEREKRLDELRKKAGL